MARREEKRREGKRGAGGRMSTAAVERNKSTESEKTK